MKTKTEMKIKKERLKPRKLGDIYLNLTRAEWATKLCPTRIDD